MAAQRRGPRKGVAVFHRLQGPFTSTVAFAPHSRPAVEFGPGPVSGFLAPDSHGHTFLGWALCAGHSPKAWKVEAKVPIVGEGRAGLASQASAPLGPSPLLLGKVHPGPSQLVPIFVSVEDVEIRCSLNPPKGQSCKSLNLLQF